jgi:hypothetical protein
MRLITDPKISYGPLRVKKTARKAEKVLVEVDLSICDHLASLLRSRIIPIDKEDSDLPGFSRKEIGNFYLFLVAICHQTSPRGQLPLEGTVWGIRRRGWDYLTAKFEESARSDQSLLTPLGWEKITGKELYKLFADAELGERLTDWERRGELIRDLGQVMQDNQWSWFEDIYQLCHRRIATGSPNLLNVLAQFQAYRDPVKKKALFLLSVMRNSGLWQYVDDEKLGPPVDYHEVRGHLRIGTVKVNDSDLRQKLLNGIPVTADEDIAIRQAVYDAIMHLSELTGLHNPSQLHYLFWNVLRSCCRHEVPYCKQLPPNCSLPERYLPLSIHPDGERCPFSDVCTSANASKRYYEHVFETDYY